MPWTEEKEGKIIPGLYRTTSGGNYGLLKPTNSPVSICFKYGPSFRVNKT
jgi:hypothetical protein